MGAADACYNTHIRLLDDLTAPTSISTLLLLVEHKPDPWPLDRGEHFFMDMPQLVRHKLVPP